VFKRVKRENTLIIPKMDFFIWKPPAGTGFFKKEKREKHTTSSKKDIPSERRFTNMSQTKSIALIYLKVPTR